MKVYLRTFGCRANHYDTEAVREMLRRAGHTIVPVPDEADVAVFNSCTVTADAEADLRQSVRRAARRQRNIRSIIMGCAAALDRGTLRALPTVSHVVPGADLPSIGAALELPVSAVAGVATQAQSSVRAVLRIQDGCDEHCTFCATSIARGRARSRPASDLVAEARALSTRHPEIVLTGIHIGSWGVERGESLGTLVEGLVRQVPSVRFRLSSLEATEVDPVLARLLRADDGRVTPHLHAPLQSGSDAVLRRMGRHWYTSARYARSVTELTRELDVFGLGADVMCGFPGETEADHAATLALVERLRFSYLHVFPFSTRPGTPADRLGPLVPSTVVDRRATELRELAARKAADYCERRTGGMADVVVTAGGGACEGVTEDFLTVRLAEPLPRGSCVRARLTTVNGRMVAVPLRAEMCRTDYLSA